MQERRGRRSWSRRSRRGPRRRGRRRTRTMEVMPRVEVGDSLMVQWPGGFTSWSLRGGFSALSCTFIA